MLSGDVYVPNILFRRFTKTNKQEHELRRDSSNSEFTESALEELLFILLSIIFGFIKRIKNLPRSYTSGMTQEVAKYRTFVCLLFSFPVDEKKLTKQSTNITKFQQLSCHLQCRVLHIVLDNKDKRLKDWKKIIGKLVQLPSQGITKCLHLLDWYCYHFFLETLSMIKPQYAQYMLLCVYYQVLNK